MSSVVKVGKAKTHSRHHAQIWCRAFILSRRIILPDDGESMAVLNGKPEMTKAYLLYRSDVAKKAIKFMIDIFKRNRRKFGPANLKGKRNGNRVFPLNHW